MELWNNYKELIILVVAWGGYVILLERRLTRVETSLKFVLDEIKRLVNLQNELQ